MKLYQVYQSNDFTEDRGGMSLHGTYNSYAEAEKLVRSRQGIMGTPQPATPSVYQPGQWSFNGYDIREIEVADPEPPKRSGPVTRDELVALHQESYDKQLQENVATVSEHLRSLWKPGEVVAAIVEHRFATGVKQAFETSGWGVQVGESKKPGYVELIFA